MSNDAVVALAVSALLLNFAIYLLNKGEIKAALGYLKYLNTSMVILVIIYIILNVGRNSRWLKSIWSHF